MKRTPLAMLFVLTGCQAAGSASLEAEVRRLRAEQERHAALIEQLQNRQNLTEDTARSARHALEQRRETITLGAEGQSPEPIRVDASTRSAEAPPAEGGQRTEIRIGRNDRIPERSPFVVHPVDRLQVVPVPPAPGQPGAPSTSPTRPATQPAQPAQPGARPDASSLPTAPSRNGRTIAEGYSTGVLDAGASTAYDDALAMVRAGRCAEATTAFADFLSRWPQHPHADNAMYWRGECLQRAGDAAGAVREWEALLERFPAGNKVPDALYKLAQARRRGGDVAAAERHERRLLEGFPDSDAARRLRDERQ